MNQAQLEQLKAALRKQWEAEAEIARIEREMAGGVPQAAHAPRAAGANSTPTEAGRPQPKGIPGKILQVFRSKPAGTALASGDLVAAMPEESAPSVRSAINRMVGVWLSRPLDDGGNEIKERYILKGTK